jgi:transposase
MTYIGPGNPVRFIDAFVAQLDLRGLGFVRAEAKAAGRPGYHPGDLLKLYIYGYVNRIRSSRRLEAESGRNLEVIWLLRGLQPDFKTIADFRKENHAAFKRVFASSHCCAGSSIFMAASWSRSTAPSSRRSTAGTITSPTTSWQS